MYVMYSLARKRARASNDLDIPKIQKLLNTNPELCQIVSINKQKQLQTDINKLNIYIQRLTNKKDNVLGEHEKYLLQDDYTPSQPPNAIKELAKKKPRDGQELTYITDHRKEEGNYTDDPFEKVEITKDHWSKIWKKKHIEESITTHKGTII